MHINACDVTLSVYPHRASLKNMPDHGGNRTYDLWNTYDLRYQYLKLISKELDSVPKYHILEPTRPRSSVGRALG